MFGLQLRPSEWAGSQALWVRVLVLGLDGVGFGLGEEGKEGSPRSEEGSPEDSAGPGSVSRSLDLPEVPGEQSLAKVEVLQVFSTTQERKGS